MNLVKKFRYWWYLRGSAEDAKKRIWKLWTRAHAVYGGPIGYGALYPFELRMIHAFLAKYPSEAKGIFTSGLDNVHSAIVGYSFLGLLILDQKLFDHAKIINPEQPMQWALGSMRVELNMAEIKHLTNRTLLFPRD